MSDERVRTIEQLRDVVDHVSFSPSCVDMGWQWEVECVFVDRESPAGWAYRPARFPDSVGWRLRCSFQRPDRETGAVSRGFGRWWLVETGTTVSGVVKTMYAAARLNVEHELMEAFKYQGVRVFDPHHTMDQLRLAADAGGVVR